MNNNYNQFDEILDLQKEITYLKKNYYLKHQKMQQIENKFQEDQGNEKKRLVQKISDKIKIQILEIPLFLIIILLVVVAYSKWWLFIAILGLTGLILSEIYLNKQKIKDRIKLRKLLEIQLKKEEKLSHAEFEELIQIRDEFSKVHSKLYSKLKDLHNITKLWYNSSIYQLDECFKNEKPHLENLQEFEQISNKINLIEEESIKSYLLGEFTNYCNNYLRLHIENEIIQLQDQYERLEIIEISELLHIEDNSFILSVIIDLINEKRLNAVYFASSKSIVFKREKGTDLNSAISNLDDQFKSWEENMESKYKKI